MPDRDIWNEPVHAPWTEVALIRDAKGIEWEHGARQRNPLKIRERLERAVDHWMEQVHAMPGLDPLGSPMPTPRIHFDLTGTIAGMAVTERVSPRQSRQWIRINGDLLTRYPVRMIQQTLPHEIAHLVVDWYRPDYRGDHHGMPWMAVMIYFGRPPLAYHSMRTEGIRRGRRPHASDMLLFEAPHG